MWDSGLNLAKQANSPSPELRQYAADKALARIVDVIFTYQQTGVVTRGAPATNARVTGISPADTPTQVAIADCGDSTNWTKHKKATGELIQDDPRGRRNITALVGAGSNSD
ncbi:hypothetical protein [Dactylosporangium salmoneum]|uniref:Uncharacterized protein n=1 Tax=Dactylosporangium salmoneum TaxID=53361 RepID=A0ABP5SYK1_9ACTN